MPMEPIVRPFATVESSPREVISETARPIPPVRLAIGLKGGSKTFSWSASATTATVIGKRHRERAPNSANLQRALQDVSGE